MASPINLPTLQGPPLRSHFLGQSRLLHHSSRPSFPGTKLQLLTVNAKFDLSEMLGGRGLCNGEKGLQQELKRNTEQELKRNIEQESPEAIAEQESSDATTISVPEDAFEKELMGLTGGFPGGEKGLNKFIMENPPPPKKQPIEDSGRVLELATSKKPRPPELPLLMPGMIAIVKNPNNPFYMYCGIVQRITDGKAGVLFEGGNWDRLITFRLEELERRDKGPPMKNPKSVILETMLEENSQ